MAASQECQAQNGQPQKVNKVSGLVLTTMYGIHDLYYTERVLQRQTQL